MNTNFGFGTTVGLGFDETIEVVTEELAKEGFGVLSDIDVRETLKKKLDTDIPPYRILGACNPVLAHQAVAMEPEIGLLLPCNVLVREDDEGKVHVSCMDPSAVLGLVDNPQLEQIASQVKEKLENVLEAI